MIKKPRYRIIQRPSYSEPSSPIFLVEKKIWFWWEPAGLFLTLHAAELQVLKLQSADANPIKTEIVKVFY